MNLKNIVTIICALYNSRTITLQQAMALLAAQLGRSLGLVPPFPPLNATWAWVALAIPGG